MDGFLTQLPDSSVAAAAPWGNEDDDDGDGAVLDPQAGLFTQAPATEPTFLDESSPKLGLDLMTQMPSDTPPESVVDSPQSGIPVPISSPTKPAPTPAPAPVPAPAPAPAPPPAPTPAPPRTTTHTTAPSLTLVPVPHTPQPTIPPTPTTATAPPPPPPPPASTQVSIQFGVPKTTYEPRTPVHYTKLKDVRKDAIVNVYGVIVDFSFPRQTKRDVLTKFTIVDPSCPALTSAVSVLVFHKPSVLSRIAARLGDVLRLLRVKVDEFNGRTQLVAQNGRQPSSLLVISSSGAVISSVPSFSFGTADAAALRTLRDSFWKSVIRSTLFDPAVRRSLGEVIDHGRSDTFMDMLVCICRIELEAGMGQHALRSMLVWDGTGSGARNNSEHLPFAPSFANNDVPPTAIRHVRVYGMQHALGRLGLDTNMWVRLRNVKYNQTNDCIKFNEESTLVELPLVCHDVQVTVKTYQEWAAAQAKLAAIAPMRRGCGGGGEDGYGGGGGGAGAGGGGAGAGAGAGANAAVRPPSLPRPPPVSAAPSLGRLPSGSPMSGTIPVPSALKLQTVTRLLGADDAPLSSLRQVLDTPPPAKFRVVCRVLQTWPSSTSDMTDRVSEADPYRYMFTLCLDDGTAAVTAIVCDDDAERFLPGLPPQDFRTHVHAEATLAQRLKRLVQPSSVMECCLMSYTSADGRLNLRLFDTILPP